MRSCLFLVACSLLATSLAHATDQPRRPESLKRLEFRNIGPSIGGRVCRAAGVPGDPLVYYAATASGGLWKSVDGGHVWSAIMDEMPTSTIGAFAVAPADPNILYAGSGEANIRGNVEVGNGIYRSTDAGKTWQHVWKQEGQIGTLVVHPTNYEVAYAAVLGKAFGPNPERGVYRTRDGKTWQQVLARNPDTGASDVAIDPINPRILFAGLWQARRKPWEMTSGGPGSGLFVSQDAGDTWTQLIALPEDADPDEKAPPPPAGNVGITKVKRVKGLPPGVWGKVCVAIAPSSPNRTFAMIEAEEGGLFRSDDGGESWSRINKSKAIRQRAWYYSTITVHPSNPEIVYFPQVPLLRSIDGGKTITRVKGPHHGDHHDIWIDPKNPDRMIDSNDGGVDISLDGGTSWFAPPLPICQFYHIDVSNDTPYKVAGSIQDIGTAMGPSNSLTSGGIPLSAWYSVGGGEAGHVVIDPTDSRIVYAGEYGGYISRYDGRTHQAKPTGIYPYNPSGHGAADLRYRFQWTAPILLSPHDPKTIYHGANVLFRSRDGGRTWTPISPDLTRNDKLKQQWSGGPITGDNTGVEVFCTIFALAESPKQKGLLWAGSDDGRVHVTTEGGDTWTDVTSGLQKVGMPEWATVVCIEPSPFDAETAFVVADAHRIDDRKPYLFVTTDRGKTWKNLAGKIPAEMGFLNVVREDPTRPGLLYLGCEGGLLFSTDAGTTWEQLKLNLPTVRVSDLKVKHGDLIVATSGRSIWILDDLTPVRALAGKNETKEARLYAPRPAYRYRTTSGPRGEGAMRTYANPPSGAILHYLLPTKVNVLTLEILDAEGKLVRRFTSKKEETDEPADPGSYSEDTEEKTLLKVFPGLHRVTWDLHTEGAKAIKGARVDMGNPKVGVLVPPGTYTIRLIADGKISSEKLEIKLDPRQKIVAEVRTGGEIDLGSGDGLRSGELEEQYRFALEVRDSITTLTRAVEQLRKVRKQLVERNTLLKEDKKASALVKASKALIEKLDTLEAQMHNPKAEVAYDILAMKGGAKLYSQLVWCLENVKDADGVPPQGVREVFKEQQKSLEQQTAAWSKLRAEELKKLNDLAATLECPGIVVPTVEKE